MFFVFYDYMCMYTFLCIWLSYIYKMSYKHFWLKSSMNCAMNTLIHWNLEEIIQIGLHPFLKLFFSPFSVLLFCLFSLALSLLYYSKDILAIPYDTVQEFWQKCWQYLIIQWRTFGNTYDTVQEFWQKCWQYLIIQWRNFGNTWSCIGKSYWACL